MSSPIRSWGLVPGLLPPGARNLITDVPGVTVGHWTLQNARHNTGLTVIVPRPGIYDDPCTAACCVINGYGKTCGLVQVEELGRLETPIALTNTLNVGLVADALVQYTLDTASAPVRSVNPVVGECNDATLNTIAERVMGYDQLQAALAAAGPDFAQGCVGAGTGMICHELKGGIGSASRLVEGHTVGVLALCNYGQLAELNILGRRPGAAIRARLNEPPRPADKGSCMLILATDLPLSSRQLKRVVRRCAVGLARCGSYWGHGSGDIAIGFTTAAHWPRHADGLTMTEIVWNEDKLDAAFAAAAEAAEESVLNALAAAVPVTGPDGRVCRALCEFKEEVFP